MKSVCDQAVEGNAWTKDWEGNNTIQISV